MTTFLAAGQPRVKLAGHLGRLASPRSLRRSSAYLPPDRAKSQIGRNAFTRRESVDCITMTPKKVAGALSCPSYRRTGDAFLAGRGRWEGEMGRRTGSPFQVVHYPFGLRFAKPPGRARYDPRSAAPSSSRAPRLGRGGVSGLTGARGQRRRGDHGFVVQRSGFPTRPAPDATRATWPQDRVVVALWRPSQLLRRSGGF